MRASITFIFLVCLWLHVESFDIHPGDRFRGIRDPADADNRDQYLGRDLTPRRSSIMSSTGGTKRRRLENGDWRWCGLTIEQCEAVQPPAVGELHTCDELKLLIETVGTEICCQMNEHDHTAAQTFISFQHEFPDLFLKENAESWDLRCDTHLQKLVGFAEVAKQHQTDFAEAKTISCTQNDETNHEDQFNFYVIQHGEKGSHLSAYLEYQEHLFETISWTYDYNRAGLFEASSLHKLAGSPGIHNAPWKSEKAAAGLKFTFPFSIVGKVIRKSPVAGEPWDLFQNSCAAAVYRVLAEAFRLTGKCVFPTQSLFYFPKDMFEKFQEAGETSGAGKKLTDQELGTLVAKGLNYEFWKNTLN